MHSLYRFFIQRFHLFGKKLSKHTNLMDTDRHNTGKRARSYHFYKNNGIHQFRESPENHLDDTQTQSRLGLLNIQKRIHLMYGTEYGLTLQNLPAGGSRVTIRLPKITTP